MKILLMHTCGVEGSVAVADEGSVRATALLQQRRGSEELMPAVRGLLEKVGWKVAEIGAVGVVRGPGSFTGVRTGLSLGKGICEALGVPLVGVSRLHLLAGRVGLVHAVVDAGRGQFYVGRVRDGVLEWQGLVGPGELAIEGRWVACERKVMEALGGFGVEKVEEPLAGDALGLVMEGLLAGVNDVLGDALYLRETDAEIFSQAKAPQAKAAGG